MKTRRTIARTVTPQFILITVATLLLFAVSWLFLAGFATPRTSLAGGVLAAAARPADGATNGPAQVIHSVKNDVSGPIRALKPTTERPVGREVPGSVAAPAASGATSKGDAALQNAFGALALPPLASSWDGITPFARPVDSNGDAGPNHYVQVVNYSMQVYSKTGTLLLGPLRFAQIWSDFGGPCSATDGSFDPVVLYDALADRWLLGAAYARQASDPAPPAGVCVAVSTSGDPTGSWNRYQFELSSRTAELWYDLPRWAVWPDGYYMSARVVTAAGSTAVPFVFERSSMLAGTTAVVQRFNPPEPLADTLPADFDGTTLPVHNAPAYFVEFPGQHDGRLATRLWKLHVDWNVPSHSSFSLAATLPVPAFQALQCHAPGCIAQPGTDRKLQTQPGLMLYRASYRNMGDHESLLFAHPAAGGTGQAGLRWYELRNPSSNPAIYQSSTFAPDPANRWAGAVAMDGAGDIALAYNVSSGDIYPSVRYAGRLASDDRNTLPRSEGLLAVGQGAQTTSSRWSDYSNLVVDPADNCTFWYSAPYLDENSSAHTRVGTFKFPSCVAAPPPIPFSDVPADSYFDVPVYYLFSIGAISGYNSPQICGVAVPCFLPFNNITRGQAAKIVALAVGYPGNAGSWTFQDVPPDSAFYPFVEALARAGIVSGYPCGGPNEPCGAAQRPYFRPSNTVTRSQLVKIVALAEVLPPGSGNQLFVDVPTDSPFFPYIQALASRNAIAGYDCGANAAEPCVAPANLPYFRPGNSITRGQGAKVIYLTGQSGAAGPTATPTPPVTATPTSVPGNWVADYYGDRTLTNFCAEELLHPLFIDKDWASPADGCPSDNFSARFTRTITFTVADTYRFTVDHDDGVRVYVDGTLFMDHWTTVATDIDDLTLAIGAHDFRIEYNQTTDAAHLHFSWAGLHPTATPTFTKTPTPVGTASPTPHADQWSAFYFADTTLTTICGQEAISSSVYLDLDWGAGAPQPNCPADNFSARFQRRIDFPGGSYNFIVSHDGGARLFVDDQPVIDNWGSDGVDAGVTSLTAGMHDIRIELNETTGQANIHFHWGVPPTPTATAQPDQWSVDYFADQTLSVLCDQQVITTTFLVLDWGGGGPSAHCPVDNFSARFQMRPDLEGGHYTFVAEHDDGVRVYVDDQPVIDKWTTYATDSGVVDLTTGPHSIRVEYAEVNGEAHLRLSWSYPPTVTTTPGTAAWSADYFSDRGLTALCGHQEFNDPFIDIDWGEGPPAASCPADNFSARFVRIISFNAATYNFHAQHDDGLRLYVDDTAVIDNWESSGIDDGQASLTAGLHNVRIEMNEILSGAGLQVNWALASAVGVKPDK